MPYHPYKEHSQLALTPSRSYLSSSPSTTLARRLHHVDSNTARRLLTQHAAAALDCFLPPTSSHHLPVLATSIFCHKFAASIGLYDSKLSQCVSLVVDPLNLGEVRFEALSDMLGLKPLHTMVSPPKRAPPPPPTLSSTTDVSQLLDEARSLGDEDMVAVLSALVWTSQHLRRASARSPRKRLRHRALSPAQIGSATGWRSLGEALASLQSDQERGLACASLLHCAVEAEAKHRAGVAQMDPGLVPEAVAAAWTAAPRVERARVRRKSPGGAAIDEELGRLSSAQRPLALASLGVDMDACFRDACANLVDADAVGHAWLNASEAARAACLGHMFDCGLFDDDLLYECGGYGMKTCLLGYRRAVLSEEPAAHKEEPSPSARRPPSPIPAKPAAAAVFAEPSTALLPYEPSALDLANAELIAQLQHSLAATTALALAPWPEPSGLDVEGDDADLVAIEKRIAAVADAIAL